MYCRNCGNKLDENAYVCVNCGVLVDSNINNSIPSRVYREKKKGDSNATGILSIIFSSLAVIKRVPISVFKCCRYVYESIR